MKLSIFLIFLLVSSVCTAESFSDIEEAKLYTDKILSKVASGDVEGGLKMMKPYVVIPPAEFDAMVGQAALQLPAIKQRFGKSTGKEFISERKVGDSVAELLYLHKFELSAMRWTFYLYKGEEGWSINTFSFDDRLPALFSR